MKVALRISYLIRGHIKSERLIWNQKVSQDRFSFFRYFLCSPQLTCSFWPHFTMMQRPSLSHFIFERHFFFPIMSVMTFPDICKQKFDELRWWWRTNHGNACEKFSILLYIVNKPYKRIFNWLITYLLITLFWKNRGFGVLGYSKKRSDEGVLQKG